MRLNRLRAQVRKIAHWMGWLAADVDPRKFYNCCGKPIESTPGTSHPYWGRVCEGCATGQK